MEWKKKEEKKQNKQSKREKKIWWNDILWVRRKKEANKKKGWKKFNFLRLTVEVCSTVAVKTTFPLPNYSQ